MGIFIVSASNFISESVNMKLRAPLSSLIPFSTSIGCTLPPYVWTLSNGFQWSLA